MTATPRDADRVARPALLSSPAFALVAAAASAAEAPVFLELLGAAPAWYRVALIHGATVGMLALFALLVSLTARRALWRARAGGIDAIAARRLAAAPAPDFWAWYLLGATAALGVIGALTTLLGFLVYLRHARHSRPFEEWYRELFPERGRRLYERIYDDLMLTVRQRQNPSQVVPFADVINYGSNTQKQLAISMMSRYFQPVFAPVLKRSLDDRNNSVRIQAATAITNLESRFSDRAMTLEQRCERDPSPKALQEFAEHLDRYAFSGLLDEDRTDRARLRAIATYRRFLELEPDDLHARIAIGRLLLRRGEIAAARDWLLETRAALGAHPRLDNWLLEAHFLAADFGSVRELARQIAARGGDGRAAEFMSDSARLWAGLPPARTAEQDA